MLVTGAAGLIGSAVIWALNRAGRDDVVACDRLDDGLKWRNLVPLRFREYVEADDLLVRLAAGSGTLGEIRTIIHLGACSATTEIDARYLFRTNYEFTKTLAELATARGVRFVYASSAATYGALERDLSEERPLASLRPLNRYAWSKQLFDAYAERSGLLERIAGLKYFNVFGPNEAHKGAMRSVVAKAYEQIVRGEPITLFRSHRPDYADGEQCRDFIYVKDVAAMTLALASDPEAVGIFNVGAGRAATWLSLVRPIFAAANVPERIAFVEMPPALRDAYQYRTCAATDRLRRYVPAGAQTPLTDAVVDYVRNYLACDARLDPTIA